MSSRKKRNMRAANTVSNTDKIYGAMLAIIVGIMPLVIRFTMRATSPDLEFLFAHTSHPDVFTIWKAVYLVVPALVIVFFCVSGWFLGEKLPDFKSIFQRAPIILSVIYLVFVIISAIASPYPHTAWFGTIHRAEGALMWMVYFIVFFAAMFYVRDPKYTKPILWGLGFSSILMGAIGAGQLVGRDFFNTRLAAWFVVGGTDITEIGTVFTIAHGTLFNPNTFGKYTAMVAPILLLAGIVYNGKHYIKWSLLLGGALMLVGVFASGSLGGLVGIAAAVAAIVITCICRFIYIMVKRENIANKAVLKRVGLMSGGLIVLTTLSILFVPPLNERVTFLLSRFETVAAAENRITDRAVFLGDTMAVYRGSRRVFSLTVHTMDIGELDHWVTVRDRDGEVVPFTNLAQDEDGALMYTFDVPGFRQGITIARGGAMFIVRLRPDWPEGFILTLDNGRLYGITRRIEHDTRVDLSQTVPAWGFEGRETWGSSRGYIWSRSFPLMPSRTIIGSGPDTFVNVFPQHDMSGLNLAFFNPFQIVDKAHNIFIQTWISTGGISALALYGLFAHYLFVTFIGLIKSKGEPVFVYGLRLGLLAGVSGFVMSSMATDSTIGSTGVFFVLLGMGYGINEYLKTTRENLGTIPAANTSKNNHKAANEKPQDTAE